MLDRDLEEVEELDEEEFDEIKEIIKRSHEMLENINTNLDSRGIYYCLHLDGARVIREKYPKLYNSDIEGLLMLESIRVDSNKEVHGVELVGNPFIIFYYIRGIIRGLCDYESDVVESGEMLIN